MTQNDILMYIKSAKKELSVKDLVKVFGGAQSGMARQIKQLEKYRLIKVKLVGRTKIIEGVIKIESDKRRIRRDLNGIF